MAQTTFSIGLDTGIDGIVFMPGMGMDFYTELNKSLDYKLNISDPISFTFNCFKRNKLPSLKIFT
jgi:hypothetical protein